MIKVVMSVVNIRSFFIVYLGILRKLPPAYERQETCALYANVRQGDSFEASWGDVRQTETTGADCEKRNELESLRLAEDVLIKIDVDDIII